MSFTALLTFAAALGLAACGSKDTGPSFSGTISDGDAADVGLEAANDFGSSMAHVFEFNGPAIAFSKEASPRAVALLNQAWMDLGGKSPRYTIRGQGVAPVLQMSIASGCNGGNYITSSGDSSDVDGDGIYANYTLTIACDTVTSGVTLHFVGTEHIQDNPGLYGYTFTINLVQEEHDTAGNATHTDISGSETAAFTTSSAQDHLNFTANESETAGGHTVGDGVHEQWDATFTPTSTPLALGDPLPDGHVAFTGGFYVTDLADATQNFNFTVQTTTPLSYKEACSGDYVPYDGGVIKGFFNGKTDVGFTATYTACAADPTVVGVGNSI
ncbi:MAG: hypothetical protein ACREL4_05035 [Gemmatimonadales bacterium]